jgi:hypothetical protein
MRDQIDIIANAKAWVEMDAQLEIAAYRQERYAAFKLHADKLVHDEEVEFVHSAAIHLGIMKETDPERVPWPAKKAKIPKSATECPVVAAAHDRSVSIMGEKCSCTLSPVTTASNVQHDAPSNITSPCLAAGEDKVTPTTTPITTQGLAAVPKEPMQSIQSSMHAPQNCMDEDESPLLANLFPVFDKSMGPIAITGVVADIEDQGPPDISPSPSPPALTFEEQMVNLQCASIKEAVHPLSLELRCITTLVDQPNPIQRTHTPAAAKHAMPAPKVAGPTQQNPNPPQRDIREPPQVDNVMAFHELGRPADPDDSFIPVHQS